MKRLIFRFKVLLYTIRAFVYDAKYPQWRTWSHFLWIYRYELTWVDMLNYPWLWGEAFDEEFDSENYDPYWEEA